MKHDWKPGEVGVTIPRYPNETETRFMVVERDGSLAFHYSDGDRVSIPPRDGGRPLVVIDPEDREQVDRLGTIRDEMYARMHPDEYDSTPAIDDDADTDLLQAALREFANPTPPKPEEPTGLGAVVEDAEGRRYIRTADVDCRLPWSYANNFSDFDWDMVAAVRVLSEGVQ